jgi:hypothetical protein
MVQTKEVWTAALTVGGMPLLDNAPPQTFTFGGIFADVITFNAHRRMFALDALQRLGAKVEGCGSPIEYGAHLASA